MFYVTGLCSTDLTKIPSRRKVWIKKRYLRSPTETLCKVWLALFPWQRFIPARLNIYHVVILCSYFADVFVSCFIVVTDIFSHYLMTLVLDAFYHRLILPDCTDVFLAGKNQF